MGKFSFRKMPYLAEFVLNAAALSYMIGKRLADRRISYKKYDENKKRCRIMSKDCCNFLCQKLVF